GPAARHHERERAGAADRAGARLLQGQQDAPLTARKQGASVMIKARVTVTLKNGVLDPQGKAIEGALGALGFAGVGSVRQGKVFDVQLETTDTAQAEADPKAMCEKLLANTVIENYQVEIVRREIGRWSPPRPEP